MMKWLQRLKSAPTPDANATKPTEPGFVGFVACPDGPSEKFTAPQQPPANEATSDPDRWCWPHSSAMNTEEIDTFTARLARFTDKGLHLSDLKLSMSLKAKWRPDLDVLELCREHGREIARQWALSPLPVAAVQTAPEQENCACAAAAAADLGPSMQCSVCQWIYDPAKGEPMQDVAPGTPWSEVPDNFLCPECSLGKDVFDELGTEAK